MRKVLSLVLVLALVLGSFSMAFAATYSDTDGTASEDAVNVLSELGVVNGYEDGTYKPEQVVTRAEAAKLVITALGLGDFASATSSSFADLSGYEWASGYIGYAESLGLLKGYEDGAYRPGNTVSYQEWATIVVRALGYTDESLPGTWPASYVTKAKTLGIMDNINAAGAAGANRGDVAIMLYQALDQAVGSVDSDNKWEAINLGTVNKPKDDTMLGRLGAKQVNDGDAFVVDGGDVDKAAINLRNSLGAYVTAYMNDDEEIIAISEVKSTYLTGEFDGDDTLTVNSVDYTIESFEYKDDAKAVQNPLFIENGEDNGATANIDTKMADGSNYTVAAKLSGKKIKEIYSVGVWTVDAAAQVDKDDLADISDEDASLLGFDFVLDDNDKIDPTAFALYGVSSLDKIEKDNVVYIYADGDDEIRRVDVGTQVVTGEITRKTTDKVTINGTQYKFSTKTNADSIADVTAGDEVEAYLDYSGRIYVVDITDGGADDYAVVVDNADGVAGLSGKDTKIKMILSDKTVNTYAVDADAIKDGDVEGCAYVAPNYTWDPAKIASGTLVKYGLDKNGKVDAIELVEVIENIGGTAYDITAKGYYDGKLISDNAVIFTFDEDVYVYEDGSFTTASDDYGVSSLDKLKDTKSVMANYEVDGGKIVAMLVVGGETSDDVYGVITAAAKIADGYEVDMLIDGAAKTLESDKSYASADFSLLHEVSYNSNGEAKLTEVAVGNAEATMAGTEVSKVSSNVVYGADSKAVISLDSDVVVYLWDTKDEVFEKSSITKIKGHEGTVEFYATDDDNAGVATIVLLVDARA